MIEMLLAASLTVSPALVKAPEIRYFGTDYYESVARQGLQSRVLEQWPGPSGLLNLWRSGQLNRGKEIGLLLGGASFHDPVLLPAYREALVTGGPRLRQAAAFGYRDLIGDAVPNVRNGVSAETARALAGELDAVARTLRRATLVEMWLASALAADETPRPDWRGITFRRPVSDCLRAVERLAEPEDLPAIVQAFELSERPATRRTLMRLIEGLSTERFVVLPRGQGKGWGGKIYTEAIERLDLWLGAHCDFEAERILSETLARVGVRGLDPMGPEACDVWLEVLDHGPSTMWAVAADRLYRCGAPPVRLSLTRPDDDSNRERRSRITDWYGY